MNSAIFSGNKVISSDSIFREIDSQTASFDECHAAVFLLDFSASVYIFLVRICLSFKLLELCQLESLLHGPFNDSTIT